MTDDDRRILAAVHDDLGLIWLHDSPAEAVAEIRKRIREHLGAEGVHLPSSN